MEANDNNEKPDSEKTNEELQREILLAQKKRLQEEEERKRRREARKVPIIVAVIVVLFICYAAYGNWKNEKEMEDSVNRIEQGLINDYRNENGISTIPMINGDDYRII